MPKTVLVTGATGRQGGAVVRALLGKDYVIRGFTRNLRSPVAQDLEQLGVELVVGDFDDPTTIESAARGVDALFAMSTPFERGPEVEVQQGKNIIDAASSAGVPHVVLTSVASANQNTGIPHFDSKFVVEQHLVESNVPYTIIAPVSFMENFTSPMALPALRAGTIYMVLPPDRAQQIITVADIGAFAATVIERGEECFGARYEIASDELTGSQTAEILSRTTGRNINYVERPLDEMRTMGPEFARMYEWILTVGYSVDIPALHAQFPDIEWHTFENWARRQDWDTLLAEEEPRELEIYT